MNTLNNLRSGYGKNGTDDQVDINASNVLFEVMEGFVLFVDKLREKGDLKINSDGSIESDSYIWRSNRASFQAEEERIKAYCSTGQFHLAGNNIQQQKGEKFLLIRGILIHYSNLDNPKISQQDVCFSIDNNEIHIDFLGKAYRISDRKSQTFNMSKECWEDCNPGDLLQVYQELFQFFSERIDFFEKQNILSLNEK